MHLYIANLAVGKNGAVLHLASLAMMHMLSKERYFTEVSVQPEAQTVSNLCVSGAYIA